MDWIKKNYDRLALLVLAIALIASAGLIYSKINSLPADFAEVKQEVPQGDTLVPADTSFVEKIKEDTEKPAQWAQNHPGSLFVSRHYLVVDGKLQDPLEAGSALHPPVPNQWLIDRGFDILNPNILDEDPDGDGFTILDEFVGGSDPNDKDSRPSYSTKLRLKEFIPRPFRLKFATYDEDSFQINTLDIRQPSQFLKLGEEIAGTKFKILRFEKKQEMNDSTGMERDISELVIQNTETEEEVVLVYNTVVNSPDSFAKFVFLLDGREFAVKKNGKFALPPEPKVFYKLLDVNPEQAVILNLDNNNKVVIPRLK